MGARLAANQAGAVSSGGRDRHQELLPLNRPGAAGFLDGDDLWLVSKRVLDDLRQHLAQEGHGGIPSRNDRLMDELQQHGMLRPDGERAVWRCRVSLSEWAHELSCLRLPADLVWPDPEQRPAGVEGAVEPLQPSGPVTSPELGDPAEQVAPPVAHPAPLSGRKTAEPGTGATGAGGAGEPNEAERPGSRDRNESPPPPSGELHAGVAAAGPQAGELEPAQSTGSQPEAGQRFLAWLKENIATGRVEINTPKARLHVVDEGLVLVSPGIFRDFDPEGWQHAQKRFQKLKLHRKTPEGTNIWTCRVAKERRESLLKVFLLSEAQALLGVALPSPNPAVTLLLATHQAAD
mgnify:CR=1 FL=1